jgi:large subunit ribosomal protein L22
MEARAVTKYLRIAPNKARLVADLIRGKRVGEALTVLRFTPKKGARFINKTLQSALASAQNTKKMEIDKLIVKTIYVDKGPVLKRWQPRAMGRATPILKRTSHITVVLSD